MNITDIKLKSLLILKVIGILILYLLIVLLVVACGEWIMSNLLGFGKMHQISTSQDSLTLLVSYVFYFIGSLLFGFIICKYSFEQSLSTIGLSIKDRTMDFLKGSILGFVLILFGFIIFMGLGLVKIVNVSFSVFDLFCLLIMFLLVAISEELVSRAIFISYLQKEFSAKTSLIISSLIFGGLHLFNENVTFLSFVNICLAGVMLGISYMFTKNLMFPIGLHFTWNYFQGPIFGFEVSGNKTYTLISQKLFGSKILNGGEFGFEGSIIAIPIMILATYWIFKHFEGKNKNAGTE